MNLHDNPQGPGQPDARPSDSPPPRRGWTWTGWVLAAVALGGVFASYLNPHFMVDLANQVWSCF